MADRPDRPGRPASASSLGVNKRLSSSMSTVYRPVHLVRLGPNQDDWFEVHLPVKEHTEVDRRSSSPGTKQPPRHHQSSPNLASLYTPRDIKSAQSTPTHTPRPQRTSPNTRTSPAKTTDDIKKTEKKENTTRSNRPPSPRQRPVSPAAPKGRTGRGDTADGPARKTPARSPSPRTYGSRQSDDKKPRTPGNKSQSQPPPIKKALTPTAAANSPSRTISSLTIIIKKLLS
ncbi:uncharacterized protein [Amphiura filiformis]|uniref:uncharacterized protein isoform X2 n=1 Tax=Amphiura filiformis TaxID=82378 RepID=UPI003B21BDC3